MCRLFLSPGCGSIKSIWGANSCQSLNPISLRGQPEVDKNSSGIEVGSTGGQKGHNNGLGGGGEAATTPPPTPSNTHIHTLFPSPTIQPFKCSDLAQSVAGSCTLPLFSEGKVPPSLRLGSLEICLALN